MATLKEAIAAIKSGDKTKGQEIIAELLKADRNNEQLWLWLTQTDIAHEQKIKSLQNVLKINPDNETAKQGLQKLQAQQPKPQTESKSKSGLLKGSEPTAPSIKEAEQTPTGQDTTTCPYCAETIKAEAVVCRFCGKDLQTEKKAIQPSQATSDIQLIRQYIAKRTKQGWQVVSQTETSAQLKKPKQWNKVLLILGGLLLIFFGTGLLLLLLAVIDYAIKKEQSIYVTVDDLKAGTDQKPTSAWSGPIILGVIIIGLVLLCIVFSLASGTLMTPSSNNISPSNKVATPTPQPTPTKKMIEPTSTVKPLGWTGDATEYTFHAFSIGRRGTYLGGVLLDGEGQIEVYLRHGQDIDNLELVADCYSFDEVGCGGGFILDLREGEHFFQVTSDGPYTLVLERQ